MANKRRHNGDVLTVTCLPRPKLVLCRQKDLRLVITFRARGPKRITEALKRLGYVRAGKWRVDGSAQVATFKRAA